MMAWDYKGMMDALNSINASLDKQTQQEIDWHIDQSGYDESRKKILKLDQHHFVLFMRAIIVADSGIVDMIGGNKDHGLVDYWVSVRKKPHSLAEELKKEIWGSGKGEGVREGEPDMKELLDWPQGDNNWRYASLTKEQQARVQDIRNEAEEHHDILRVFLRCDHLGIDSRYVTDGLDIDWIIG